MVVKVRPVELDTGSADHEGVLVFDESESLVAILVRLSDLHGERAGDWRFEYGPAFRGHPKDFTSLDQAVTWIEEAKTSASSAETDSAKHQGPA
jgi:predicted metal-dependent phosphoesterase TrpH